MAQEEGRTVGLALPNLLITITGDGDPANVRQNSDDLRAILGLQGFDVHSIKIETITYEVKAEQQGDLIV